MQIFGNDIPEKIVRRAIKNQKKFIRKFGDDRGKKYHLTLADNPILTKPFDCKIIQSCSQEGDLPFAEKLPPKAIIIGNIRMGFGHYRMSMAMVSAAKALGYTPLWFDLNSFPETTCTKIISHQNKLYSTGSRLSQKSRLFNKLVWEPLNSEGFKKLSYNAGDQYLSELMTSVFSELPKDIPFIATHVWPSQAAIHAGMTRVVNAIPDNWPMALHLSEGAIHAVQSYSSYWGYKNLIGFAGKKILKPMGNKDLLLTGHYVDYELVSNIEEDCRKRIERANKGGPVRFLFTIGGAGAQGEFIAAIIKALLPYVKENKACVYINCGDYQEVWALLKQKLTALTDGSIPCFEHFDDWQEETAFAQEATAGAETKGLHAFCNKDIFAAVYITNLLMRASDILVTKPSELAFYPIPKLFIKRVGGHEKWGAIHSSELGEGTQECERPEEAIAAAKAFIENPLLIQQMCDNIIRAKEMGIYDGALNTVKIAIE